MDDIEEIQTFNGLVGYCTCCGVQVDPFRKLAHIREDGHRKFSSAFSANSRASHNLEDKLLQQKYDELAQTEDEYDAVREIVIFCEETLKLISDEFLRNNEAESKKKQEDEGSDSDSDDSSSDESNDENEPPEPPKRNLKGVMRAGPLADGLLMKGELEAWLILSTEDKPTFKLLRDVHESFVKLFPSVSESKKYKIELRETRACVMVHSSDDPVQVACRISITSSKCCAHPFKLFNDGTPPDPEDMLPRAYCEESLRALRRARWFEANCCSERHCDMVTKVLRDLCRKEAVFNAIDDWMIQQLFYKVISSPGAATLSLSRTFQSFFECISSGILLPGDIGLYDPCEREPTGLCDKLTDQQRLDITTAAQKMLRMIAQRQLHTILGYSEKVVDHQSRHSTGPDRKRRRESRDNGRHGKRRRN